MDAATIATMFNLFRNSPELIGAFITWLQATEVLLAKLNAAQK